MRKGLGVLTAFVVSGAISAASAETRTAEDEADVALVEREIRAVDEAIAIHKRAKERAERAVALSSLGQKYRKTRDEAAKAWEALRASRAHREHLGEDKIKDRRTFAILTGENVEARFETWFSQRYRAEIDRRRKAYEEASKVPTLLSQRANRYAEQIAVYVKRMTRIFLTNEIEQAQQRKLDGLTRELKKIRQKDYEHI